MKIMYFLLALVAIVGLFYWFEWRPVQIKKTCNAEAESKMPNISHSAYFEKNGGFLTQFNLLYDTCLRKKGL